MRLFLKNSSTRWWALVTFLKKILNSFSRLSIRLRLTLTFVVIFGTTTILFNTFLFLFMIQTLQQDFDDALFNYSVDVSESIEIGIKGDLKFPPLKLDTGKVLPFPLGTALIQVIHSSGTVLARVGDFGDFNPSFKKDFERLSHGEEETYRTISNISKIPSAEADSYRLISVPLDNSTSPQVILQIAVPMTLLDTQIANRLTMLQIGIPLVLLIATLGGLFFSSRALAPVKSMISAAQGIDASELSQRVPVPSANDEIKKLSLTLNEMLARIHQAFQSQERFVADASHQLLTPLTIMKGEIEVMQKHEFNQKDVDGFLKSSLQEIDTLTKIVKDMLLLARVDAGLGALSLEELHLDDMVLEAISRVEKVANAKNIRLKFDILDEAEGRKTVRGDYDLLLNLLINVMENAIKYSPENEMISISLIWQKDISKVVVMDHGVGIPDEQLPYIFERFSRGSNAERNAKGFGLGLAIAQKIAILHHAKLYAANNTSKGAQFHFEIKNI
ncbi:sensor histidine kinase [Bdellovibrio sp. HCB337]|uniref:sensor histidine kinase n=1 Tax=Bdellovibrio sp. HCB337 TaxID=3394358 RepID=UPI0039A6DE9E